MAIGSFWTCKHTRYCSNGDSMHMCLYNKVSYFYIIQYVTVKLKGRDLLHILNWFLCQRLQEDSYTLVASALFTINKHGEKLWEDFNINLGWSFSPSISFQDDYNLHGVYILIHLLIMPHPQRWRWKEREGSKVVSHNSVLARVLRGACLFLSFFFSLIFSSFSLHSPEEMWGCFFFSLLGLSVLFLFTSGGNFVAVGALNYDKVTSSLWGWKSSDVPGILRWKNKVQSYFTPFS